MDSLTGTPGERAISRYGLDRITRDQVEVWSRKRALTFEAGRQVRSFFKPAPRLSTTTRSRRASNAQRSRGVVPVGATDGRRRRAVLRTARRRSTRGRARRASDCDAAEGA